MVRLTSRAILLAAVVWGAGATTASAQVFGTFSWQLQPYCNVVTLTLSQFPAGFVVDGSDNQCGAGRIAAATGQALIHPDGTVGVNFTVIGSPDGKGSHVAAVVNPASGSGSWSDNVGNSGTFVLSGAVPGLPARPVPTSGLGAAVVTTVEIAPGAVGAADINPAEVQSRVSGSCPAGLWMTGVNADGTVMCVAVAAPVMLRWAGQGNEPSDPIFNSTTALNFVGPTVNVTLSAGQKAMMNITKAMGAGDVAATGLRTYPCARLASLPATANATGFFQDGAGVYIGGHQVPANTRIDFSMNYVYTTDELTAGQTYTVGMCAQFPSGGNANWINNEWGLISVLVTTAR